MPKRQAKLTGATQLGFPAGVCLVSTLSCLLRARRQIIVGIETACSETTQRRGVCGDEIITSDDAFEGNPTVCFCSKGGESREESHFEKTLFPRRVKEGDWRREGRHLDIWMARIRSVLWIFFTWRNSAALFHPGVARGSRMCATHSGSWSHGSSLFHYTHNLQLRHA